MAARALDDLRGLSDEAIGRLVLQLTDLWLSKELVKRVDKAPIRSTKKQIRDGRRIARWLRGITRGQLTRLPAIACRTSFLVAAADHVDSAATEFLVVGFGTKNRDRTKVEDVLVLQGDASRVPVPPQLAELVFGALAEGRYTEVVLVHNHPDNIFRELKNWLLGPKNLPSGQDRSLRLGWHTRAAFIRAQVPHPASLRFYLIENGKVCEFGGFSLFDLLRELSRLVKK